MLTSGSGRNENAFTAPEPVVIAGIAQEILGQVLWAWYAGQVTAGGSQDSEATVR